ncbi:MAG: N-6 DNA methylase, partial [Planctomycetota bacterium]
MSVDVLHDRMAWPSEDELFAPDGIGPRILHDLSREKIERTIRRELGDETRVRVGLLTKNAKSSNTEAPIAVVCEFPRSVSDSILALAHRLAWNFARSPLLITVEPHLVRAWTCCEPPDDETGVLFQLQGEIDEARLDLTATLTPSERAAHALHWVRLATGDFYRQFPNRFLRDGRADRVLLEELTAVRLRLQRQGLAEHEDAIHDLLARIVFAQFLFDRRDADGTAALNPSLLSKLRDEGHLHGEHSGLATILADYDEAYRFFRWLNEKFNGDLFPGKGKTPEQREAEWQAEMSLVEPRHLETLASFVSGRMRGRQRTLWRLYRFDVIPLELISSIYEEFVTSAGAHYTPGFLVDFMLDEVLPWEGDDWKVKILDPACGSGMFLVKAYQRLIQRWKNANPGCKPSAAVLRRLLERYLYGCDIDPHAVRVASFSLYLTMCDEIDPKNYLKNTKFPRLRDKRLIHADFFREDKPGLSTADDGPTYDLVVGNAPWGKNTETEFARQWAKTPAHDWGIANKAIGTLFLAKAASLTKSTGRVSMIQPASSLLFNRSGPANRFRERLFSDFKVEEVVNLSTLRFELFENATSPPCIVTLRPIAPDGEPLLYISPKQVKSAAGADVAERQVKPAGGAYVAESSYSIVIEPHDISQVFSDEAAFEPNIWTALAWGGRRDLMLMKRLSLLDTLEKYRKNGLVASREGMIRGDREHRQNQILNRPLLEQDEFPTGTLLFLNADRLLPNQDP